ncbi:MAG TPA: glycosyl transferase [Chloroflexi bacterium]|nr:glycosyl transferase [Chloroflexota bacterium]
MRPKLSVLIPVYNEEESVREVLQRVARVDLNKEIIVVNDCSTDRTARILAELENELTEVRVIHHQVNGGKGAAIRTALAAATGDYVIIQDADLEYEPEDFIVLLQPVLESQARVVYGVRDLSPHKPLMRWGNWFLTWLTNLFYGARLHDMETCYKLMAREIAQSFTLECNRFDIEPELTAKILKRGHRIVEVPISYRPRFANKKLSPLDGWPAVKALLKYRFVG